MVWKELGGVEWERTSRCQEMLLFCSHYQPTLRWATNLQLASPGRKTGTPSSRLSGRMQAQKATGSVCLGKWQKGEKATFIRKESRRVKTGYRQYRERLRRESTATRSQHLQSRWPSTASLLTRSTPVASPLRSHATVAPSLTPSSRS